MPRPAPSECYAPLLPPPAIACTLSPPLANADADGFTESFDPKNSTFYVPQSSKTFVPIKNQAFFLGYADNTHLKGFQGEDVLQLGECVRARESEWSNYRVPGCKSTRAGQGSDARPRRNALR